MNLIKHKMIGAGVDIFGSNMIADMSNIALIGLESDGQVLQEYTAKTHFLAGITMDQVVKLKAGLMYLEFWTHGIDHTKPTINRRWYPSDKMREGLGADAITKQLNQGGIPGCAEHPQIKANERAKPGEAPSQNEIQNIISDITYIDPFKVTHYIVGYKCFEDRTIFKIRTALKNLTIVNDILSGKIPAFSIRTHGLFVPDNAFGGCHKAAKINFVTIDYVGNQADVRAIAEPQMDIVDVVSGEKMRLQVDSRIGNENDMVIDNFYKKNDIWVRKSTTAMESAFNHGVQISVKASEKEMLREVCADIW